MLYIIIQVLTDGTKQLAEPVLIHSRSVASLLCNYWIYVVHVVSIKSESNVNKCTSLDPITVEMVVHSISKISVVANSGWIFMRYAQCKMHCCIYWVSYQSILSLINSENRVYKFDGCVFSRPGLGLLSQFSSFRYFPICLSFVKTHISYWISQESSQLSCIQYDNRHRNEEHHQTLCTHTVHILLSTVSAGALLFLIEYLYWLMD